MDLRKVKTLIDLVQQSGISELEITEGEERVRICRGPIMAAPAVTTGQLGLPSAMTAISETGAGYASAPSLAPEVQLGHVLKSPMVGTFYRAASPGGEPFVNIGQAVKTKDIVCIIEAMKLLNEIEGGADGVIKEILVENGQPVEYGQPLMVIE